MSLRDVIKLGVDIANRVTKPVQSRVSHAAWIGDTTYGDSQFAPPIFRDAIVEKKQQFVKGQGGEMVLSKAQITFLDPIAPYKTGGFAKGFAQGFTMASIEGRTEPIDARDQIILPDGTTGQIVAQNGFMDPITARPFVNELWIG